MRTRYIYYRCTEQQLQDHLDHISSVGDRLIQATFKGGRDWVLFLETTVAES